ncbi:MAG: hypothetical protein K0R00_887 [Herbinix sp.]|jgi:hypothetical protein|nr:hypothetical protein [Herbinix sp.]
MKTLIIYDTTGKIWSNITGNYEVPVGIPYLEVNIPDGKYPYAVDVSVTPNQVIYEDNPKSLELTIAEIAVETDFRLSMLELGLV